MDSKAEAQKGKQYCDYKKFKGNTFESNINSINNLLLGKAQKISNTQFIYVDEKDGKNYISANYIMIKKKTSEDKKDNKEQDFKMYYPQTFIHSIHFYDDKLFYINKNSHLLIFKIGQNSLERHIFVQKEEEKKDSKNNKEAENEVKNVIKTDTNDIKENEINTTEDTNGKVIQNDISTINDIKNTEKDILNNRNKEKGKKKKGKDTSNNINDQKNEKPQEKEFEYKEVTKENEKNVAIDNYEKFLEKIKKLKRMENSNLNKRYDILFDILQNDIKEDLKDINSPKNISKIIKIDFEDIEKCEIRYYSLELDCTGIIQEQLNVPKGKMTFKDGIADLKSFIKDKKNKNAINNTFKTPIIFKNFEEEFIPSNEAIICEIKAGCDIETLKSQIKERIKIVNDCLFEDYKPSYYIGVVNVNENSVDILNSIKDILDNDFNFEEKIIIISTINYCYCDIDASYEVHTDYILYKKLNNMDNGIKRRFHIVYISLFIIFLLSFIFFISTKNDINIMRNDINTKINDINTKINDMNVQMDKKFNELYQILIDGKKNDNKLLNNKKSFNSKENSIAEDVCNSKEF